MPCDLPVDDDAPWHCRQSVNKRRQRLCRRLFLRQVTCRFDCAHWQRIQIYWCLQQGSNLEEQSDSHEQYSSDAAADSLEHEFDPSLEDEEEDSKETLGESLVSG